MKLNVPVPIARKVADAAADSQDDDVRLWGQRLARLLARESVADRKLTAEELDAVIWLVSEEDRAPLQTMSNADVRGVLKAALPKLQSLLVQAEREAGVVADV